MTVKYGFVGAGAIAYPAAAAINGFEDSKVVAVYDPNMERAKQLCEEKEIATACETVEELFASPDVDAVYIAVPNKFHAPLALQALNAGKHVLLEKPFAMNYAEAEEVVKTAEAKGLKFMVGMNQRFREESQSIRSLVKDGLMGDIYHAKAFWFRRSGIPRLGTWFGNKELSGGGCLLDIGVHLLDLCLHTIGNFEPVSVSGFTYSRFGKRGLGEGGWGRSDREDITFDVDDFAGALIRMKNGATVTLDVSWAGHAEEGNRMNVHIYGDDAGAGLYPAKLFRNDPVRQDYDVVENVRSNCFWPEKCRFANFTKAILGKEEQGVKNCEALAVQKILDAIYESAKTGREVVL